MPTTPSSFDKPRRTAPSESRQHGLLPLSAVLLHEGPLAPLCAKAQALAKAEHALHSALPAAFGALCQVVGLEENRLTVFVTHAAVAARLRQMTPTLCQHLQKVGVTCDALLVKVRPPPAAPDSPPANTRLGVRIDEKGREALCALALRLEENSPLRTAVENLCEATADVCATPSAPVPAQERALPETRTPK
jgi:hypothetical protein